MVLRRDISIRATRGHFYSRTTLIPVPDDWNLGRDTLRGGSPPDVPPPKRSLSCVNIAVLKPPRRSVGGCQRQLAIRRTAGVLAAGMLWGLLSVAGAAEDWPQFQFDAGRPAMVPTQRRCRWGWSPPCRWATRFSPHRSWPRDRVRRRWAGRRGAWTRRHCDAGAGDAGRRGQLQQRVVAGHRRRLPAFRHHGRIVLRAGPRDGAWSARSTAASRCSPPRGRQRARLLRHGRRQLRGRSGRQNRLDVGLRQGSDRFDGDRWSGEDWLEFKQGRVTWRDHFCCSRDLAAIGKTLVIPAGGRDVFLEDAGDRPRLRVTAESRLRRQRVSRGFRLSAGAGGGRLRAVASPRQRGPRRDPAAARRRTVETRFRAGHANGDPSAGAAQLLPVSVRGSDVYRCRPEEGFGFCRHASASERPRPWAAIRRSPRPCCFGTKRSWAAWTGGCTSCRSPAGPAWSFAPLGPGDLRAGGGVRRADLSAAKTAICTCSAGRRGLAGSRLGPETDPQSADRPVRRPSTTGTRTTATAEHQRHRSGVQPPLRIKWMRRYEGTFKHLPVCGGGRMYTHTSEGQVFAVEQETGRCCGGATGRACICRSLRRCISNRGRGGGGERLLVPQAGMSKSRLRCLDAATGELLWEAPFTGSPSWSRQAPPVIWENWRSTPRAPAGTPRREPRRRSCSTASRNRRRRQEVMSWIYTHDNPYYPQDNRPLIWAWDLDTGQLVWQQDFSDHGTGGNDCGLCLLDGRSTTRRSSAIRPASEDAAACRRAQRHDRGLDPTTGEVLWLTAEYYVTAGCTISAADGRLYLGGYNQPDESSKDRYVFCLDARDGSLVWRTEPVRSAVNVVTVGKDYIFSNASGGDGHVFDRATGKIVSRFNLGYACTRFTCPGRTCWVPTWT